MTFQLKSHNHKTMVNIESFIPCKEFGQRKNFIRILFKKNTYVLCGNACRYGVYGEGL
jgi:hypothetical protein